MRNSLAVTLALVVTALAQDTQHTPTFRAGTKLVLVPVVVRDRDGRAVPDLIRQTFQLSDKGKPQRIESFSIERTGAAASGTASPQSFTVYFFDDLALHDIGSATALRDAAVKAFGNLQPGDRVAVFSSSCRLAVDFTNDASKLQEVAAKLQPNPIPVCRVAAHLPLQPAVLQAVVQRMQRLPGLRRIVVISSGFRVPINQQSQGFRDQLVQQAAAARVIIDSLHIPVVGVDSAGPGDWRNPHQQESPVSTQPDADVENLHILADGTGGSFVEAGNSPDAGLRELATPECVYMLGFALTANPTARITSSR